MWDILLLKKIFFPILYLKFKFNSASSICLATLPTNPSAILGKHLTPGSYTLDICSHIYRLAITHIVCSWCAHLCLDADSGLQGKGLIAQLAFGQW